MQVPEKVETVSQNDESANNPPLEKKATKDVLAELKSLQAKKAELAAKRQ